MKGKSRWLIIACLVVLVMFLIFSCDLFSINDLVTGKTGIFGKAKFGDAKFGP